MLIESPPSIQRGNKTDHVLVFNSYTVKQTYQNPKGGNGEKVRKRQTRARAQTVLWNSSQNPPNTSCMAELRTEALAFEVAKAKTLTASVVSEVSVYGAT